MRYAASTSSLADARQKAADRAAACATAVGATAAGETAACATAVGATAARGPGDSGAANASPTRVIGEAPNSAIRRENRSADTAYPLGCCAKAPPAAAAV